MLSSHSLLLGSYFVFLCAIIFWFYPCRWFSDSYAVGHYGSLLKGFDEYAIEKYEFVKKNPQYGYNGTVDLIVNKELTRFSGHVYLDYTGSGVYTETQINNSMNQLVTSHFGNTHSINPSSQFTDRVITEIRQRILKHFDAAPGEYSVVFTSGATAALKIVGESFPWSPQSTFAYLRQNHNSVLGIREFVMNRGATFRAVPESLFSSLSKFKALYRKYFTPFVTVPKAQLSAVAPHECQDTTATNGSLTTSKLINQIDMHGEDHTLDDLVYSLFAFPGEENFSGVKFPVASWLDYLQNTMREANDTTTTTTKIASNVESGDSMPQEFASRRVRWLSLVDIAAHAPTNYLSLSQMKNRPDFLAASFYKMFGYPTGLGVLIIKNSVSHLLKKPYFGGGAVTITSCEEAMAFLQSNPSRRFEDGTIPFLSIANLQSSFDALERIAHSNQPAVYMHAITMHVASLTRELYRRLSSLSHPITSEGGEPMSAVVIYGKHYEAWKTGKSLEEGELLQGGIVTFNLIDKNGQFIGYNTVQKVLVANNIHVRTGCACNPGACHDALGFKKTDVERLGLEHKSCGDETDLMKGEGGVLRPLGAIRISMGYLSTFEDVFLIANVIKKHFVDQN